MYGFADFDDFRVGAWKAQGVMMIVEDAVDAAKAIFKRAAVAAAVVATAITVPQTAIASSSVVTTSSYVEVVGQASALDLELGGMASDIDSILGGLSSLTVDSVDQDMLGLAKSALSASDSRKSAEQISEAVSSFFKDMQ